MRTVFQKQSSRKTVSFEEQNTVVPKIHRHSLSCRIPYYLAWRPNPEKPGIWNYQTIFSFHWDTTEVWRPHFDVKKVLLSRKTGSVSIGKRLLHFIFGDAQLLKFGYHAIRGRLPLTTAFIYGQSPITRLLPFLPQLKIVVICATPEYAPPPKNSCTSFNVIQFNILGELKADVEKACPSTLEIVDP